MTEDAEEDKEPAEPRETVPAHREKDIDDANNEDEDEPVSPAEQPAVIPADPDCLRLRD